MPQTFALQDSDRELLRDAIAVSGEAHAAILAGSDSTRLFVGMQLSGLTMALEKVFDVVMGLIPAAYEQGLNDRESEYDAGTRPTLRLVAR